MVRRRREPPAWRPKRGPGQEFAAEFVAATDGHARRFRNVNVSPLQAAWFRGFLNSPGDAVSRVTADDRFAAGEMFERLWYMLDRTGFRDSTEAVIGHGAGLFFSESQQDAGKRLVEIRGRMQATNYQILKLFCGGGFSLSDALRVAGVDVHPDGRAYRLREALDDLVGAVSGWRTSARC